MNWRPLSLTLICLGLAACSRDMSDLETYIAEVKARKSRAVDPIPQMQPYEPFAYNRENERAPFEPFQRQVPTQAEVEAKPTNALQPDFARNREPLESFPLGSLRLHGTLEINQNVFALIQAPDGVVHRVTYGDHMGQNFGKLVQISAVEVALEEIVPDGFGAYVKRPATIAISDTKKSSDRR